MLSLVRDDHIPFQLANVPILHLIPHPFPKVWHRMDDDLSNVNYETVQRLATVLKLFLLNLFHFGVK